MPILVSLQHLPIAGLIWPRVYSVLASGVVKLAEWSLLTPENPGSNPAIGNIYLLLTVYRLQKVKIKKKRPRISYFVKKIREYINKFIKFEQRDRPIRANF